ncbi:MAG: HAD hydrolase-like protein, partial [Afipia sp.]|nr:HAD hydrolase-like protein [Afipia sp.]
MNYRLALFDFDGTLADSFTWFSRVVNDAADKFGFRRIAPQDFDMLRGKGAREIIAHLGMPFWKMPAIARFMRARKAADIASIGLFDGAADMLGQVREAGLTLAIISSNSEANVRAVLGPQTAALIRHYGCGASIFGKTAQFKKALRQTGVSTAHTLAIGDELRDIDAARAAGIAFGAVAWGYTLPDALQAQQPHFLFGTMNEI